MATDPPTLSLLPPPIQLSPIIIRVFTFDEMDGVHDQQTFGYPRIEDTRNVDHRPDNDIAMEDVAKISDVVASDDHVDIEFALRNANLDSCKEALPALRSSDDDEDDGGHEKQSDVLLFDHLNIIGLNSGDTSHERDSIPQECSRHGGLEPHAKEKGRMTLDAVDYEMDVYEAAMYDPSDGGADAFFRLEHSSKAANISRNKVRLFFPFSSNFKIRFLPRRLFFFPHLCLIP
jgi:hypothetical protein